MRRQADHEPIGLPLAQQFTDGLETIVAIAVRDHGERAGAVREHVAERDADALFAVIAREQGGLSGAPSGRHAHA
jgi:hypothetical protein